MYCLFWGLNMNMLAVDNAKWMEDSIEDVKKLADKITESVSIKEEVKIEQKPQGALSKMKAFVRKAVDCCIE